MLWGEFVGIPHWRRQNQISCTLSRSTTLQLCQLYIDTAQLLLNKQAFAAKTVKCGRERTPQFAPAECTGGGAKTRRKILDSGMKHEAGGGSPRNFIVPNLAVRSKAMRLSVEMSMTFGRCKLAPRWCDSMVGCTRNRKRFVQNAFSFPIRSLCCRRL